MVTCYFLLCLYWNPESLHETRDGEIYIWTCRGDGRVSFVKQLVTPFLELEEGNSMFQPNMAGRNEFLVAWQRKFLLSGYHSLDT